MHKFLPLLVLAVGCGIPDGKLLVDLTADDMTKLCESIEPATYTCEMTAYGYEITYDITLGGDDCESGTDGLPDSCEATVGDWRDCDAAMRAAFEADPCTTDMPSECDALFACVDTSAT